MTVTTAHVKNSWRWLVCGLDGTVKTNLDRLATGVSMQYVLDESSEMQCDLPSDNSEVYRHASDGEPFVSYGRRIVYGLRREAPVGGPPWKCRWSGVMTINQDQAHSDEPVTHMTAHDPWTWAKSVPVLQRDGSLPPQKGVTYTNMRGDEIALDVIANAYTWMETQFGPTFPWNGLGVDSLFIDIVSGDFEHTDVIPKITFQQGASVAEAWSQLCQTGGLDIVLKPIYRPRDQPGVLCTLNVYNQAGSDRPGALFGWDMFPRNLVGVDDLLDGTQLENWAQFYAGGTAAEHASSSGSIASYGPYFVQKNLSGPSNKAAVSLLAAAEVALRKKGKQTLVIEPAPELAPDPFTHYFLGDTVYVWGGRELPPFSPPPPGIDSGYGNALRHGLRSGSAPTSHRIYGFQVDLADDQTETITNLLLTDPDATA